MQEQFDYIDGFTTTFVKEQLVNNIEHIVNELRDDDFHDDEIYEYLKKIVLTVMNGKTYEQIRKLLDMEIKNRN